MISFLSKLSHKLPLFLFLFTAFFFLTESAEAEEAADLSEKEEMRIAEELSHMEETASEYQLKEDEKIITGKNDQLSFYEFENEELVPQQTEEGLVVIHSSDGNIIRNFYDSNYRLIKKEEWNIKSASDSVKRKTENYIYSEESGRVIQKDIYTANTYEKVLYNPSSLPVSASCYAISEKKNYILMERNWLYDDKNQLIKDVEKDYSYKNNDYKNKPVVLKKQYEYIYYDLVMEDKDGNNTIPPDSKYYENDVLKMQNKYTPEKGTWYSWVFFDENLSVKTYYEKEFKVYEEFYNAGKLMRKKLYDKMD